MSAANVIVERVKEHPYIILGGVAVVLLFAATRKSTAATNSGGSGVYSVAADPNVLALQAQQISASAATAQASLAAQTQQSAISAQRDIQLATVAAGENVATAKIGASMFDTAAAALTTNYALQQNYIAAQSGQASVPAMSVSGVQNGFQFVPGQAGWQDWMAPFAHGNTNVPIVSTTPGTMGDVGVINTANTQLEQLFNNVLRAGQGTAPLETAILTTPPTPGTATVTGTAHIDPVFLDWTSNGLRSITDVTPGADNAFGFTGSFTNLLGASQLTFH